MYNRHMNAYTKNALKKLQTAGLKITKQRQLIVDLLTKSAKALSPYEMRDILKKQGIKADVVTIYRVLELLEKLSLAHKVLAFNGYIGCSTFSKTSCHHYLLCKNCHRAQEVEGDDLSQIEKRIRKIEHFRIDSHYLEFIGLCAKCQKKAPGQKERAPKG